MWERNIFTIVADQFYATISVSSLPINMAKRACNGGRADQKEPHILISLKQKQRIGLRPAFGDCTELPELMVLNLMPAKAVGFQR